MESITIEDEAEFFIDLVENETATDLVYEWDEEVRKKFLKFRIQDNEQYLYRIMEEYLKVINSRVEKLDIDVLKAKIIKHLYHFNILYMELNCCFEDMYLQHMEDILSFYCNLELQSFNKLKRSDVSKKFIKKRGKQIIRLLTVYLMDREESILHVLLKLKFNKESQLCKDIIHLIYNHFLIKIRRTNLSDETFCRTYLAFQKWKTIRETSEWKAMDCALYIMFNRTPEDLKKNSMLQKILTPQKNASTILLLKRLRACPDDICNSYFEYIRSKKTGDNDFQQQIAEDNIRIPILDDDESYNDMVQKMSNLSQNEGSLGVSDSSDMKIELEDDDDVQIIENSQSTTIILDDTEPVADKAQSQEVTDKSLHASSDIPLQSLPVVCDKEIDRDEACSVETISDAEKQNEMTSEESECRSTEMECDEGSQINQESLSDKASVTNLESVHSTDVEHSIEIENRTVTSVCKYGLDTPLSDQENEEHGVRSSEPCVYSYGLPDSLAACNILSPTSPVDNLSSPNPTLSPVFNEITLANEEDLQCETVAEDRSNDTETPNDFLNDSNSKESQLIISADEPIGTSVATDVMSSIATATVSLADSPSIKPLVVNTISNIKLDWNSALSDLIQTSGSTPAEITTSPLASLSSNTSLTTAISSSVSSTSVNITSELSSLNVSIANIPLKNSQSSDSPVNYIPSLIVPLVPQPPVLSGILTVNCPNNSSLTLDNPLICESEQDPTCTSTLTPSILTCSDVISHTTIETDSLEKEDSQSAVPNVPFVNLERLDPEILKGKISNSTLHIASVTSCAEDVTDGADDIPLSYENIVKMAVQNEENDELNEGTPSETDLLNSSIHIDTGQTEQSCLDEFERFLQSSPTLKDTLLGATCENFGYQDDVVDNSVPKNQQPNKGPNGENDFPCEPIDKFLEFFDKKSEWLLMEHRNRRLGNKSTEHKVKEPEKPLKGIIKKYAVADSTEKTAELTPSDSIINRDFRVLVKRLTSEEIDKWLNKKTKHVKFDEIESGKVKGDRVRVKKFAKSSKSKNSRFDRSKHRVSFFLDESKCKHQTADSDQLEAVTSNHVSSSTSNGNEYRDNELGSEEEHMKIIEAITKKGDSLDHPMYRVIYDKVGGDDAVNMYKNNEVRNPDSLDAEEFLYNNLPDDETHSSVQSICDDSSVCNLSVQFDNLQCNINDSKLSEDVLNLSIPFVNEDIVLPESEFSNSPNFLQDTDQLLEKCLEETLTTEAPSTETFTATETKSASFLSDNSNFYTQTPLTKTEPSSSASSDIVTDNFSAAIPIETDKSCTADVHLPTAVPETYNFELNNKNEIYNQFELQNLENEFDIEMHLPLKKRKLTMPSTVDVDEKKEEISYPATPMISIAEVEELRSSKLRSNCNNNTRPFKTPAERKEMPPLPVFYNGSTDPSPIITDQFNINNHTYNNPTINYHMNNVPVPFINIPCGSYYPLPPILLPFNNVQYTSSNMGSTPQEATTIKKENIKKPKKRKK